MGWLSDRWDELKDSFIEAAIIVTVTYLTGGTATGFTWAAWGTRVAYTGIALFGLRQLAPDPPGAPEGAGPQGGGATVQGSIPPRNWIFGKRRVRANTVWFGEAEHRWTLYLIALFGSGDMNRVVTAYSGEHSLQVPLVRGYQVLCMAVEDRSRSGSSGGPDRRALNYSSFSGGNGPLPFPLIPFQAGGLTGLPAFRVGPFTIPANTIGVDRGAVAIIEGVNTTTGRPIFRGGRSNQYNALPLVSPGGRFTTLHQQKDNIRAGNHDNTVLGIVEDKAARTLISAGPYYDQFDQPSSSSSYVDSLIKVQECFNDRDKPAGGIGWRHRFRRLWRYDWRRFADDSNNSLPSDYEGVSDQDLNIVDWVYRYGQRDRREPRISFRDSARISSTSLPWTRSHFGYGASYAYMEFRQSHDKTWNNTERNAWQSPPNLEWVVEGIKVEYPVRNGNIVELSNPEYTTNPAKIRAWGLLNRRADVEIEDIDIDSLEEAIATCDETIIWHGAASMVQRGEDAGAPVILNERLTGHFRTRAKGTVLALADLPGGDDTHGRLQQVYIAHSDTIPYISPKDINSGWTPLFYLTPENWDDPNGDSSLTPGLAKLYNDEIYVNDEALPSGYWTASRRANAPDSRWRKLDATQTRRLPDNTPFSLWKHCPAKMKRYEAHGEFVSGQSVFNQEAALDQAMDGVTVQSGGKYYFTAGRGERLAPGGQGTSQGISTRIVSKLTLTDNDLVNEGVSYLRVTPPREQYLTSFNVTLAQCETDFWNPLEFTITDAEREGAEGERLEGRAVRLESVSNVMQARSIANAALIDARDPAELQVQLTPKLGPDTGSNPNNSIINLKPGDVVTCNFTELGSPRDMLINSYSLNLDSWVVTIGLVSYTPNVSNNYLNLPALPAANP